MEFYASCPEGFESALADELKRLGLSHVRRLKGRATFEGELEEGYRALAATYGIEFSFFSSGYLDVSVPRVPFHTLWIGVWMTEVCSAGFPHSEISGSKDICSSPKLIAAYHVFLRLLVPRHPPCALIA